MIGGYTTDMSKSNQSVHRMTFIVTCWNMLHTVYRYIDFVQPGSVQNSSHILQNKPKTNSPKSMTFLCWILRLSLNWQINLLTECWFTGLSSILISALIMSLHWRNTDPATMCSVSKSQLHASAMLDAIPWMICVPTRESWEITSKLVWLSNEHVYNQTQPNLRLLPSLLSDQTSKTPKSFQVQSLY